MDNVTACFSEGTGIKSRGGQFRLWHFIIISSGHDRKRNLKLTLCLIAEQWLTEGMTSIWMTGESDTSVISFFCRNIHSRYDTHRLLQACIRVSQPFSVGDVLLASRKTVTILRPTSFITTIFEVNTFAIFFQIWNLLATPRVGDH